MASNTDLSKLVIWMVFLLHSLGNGLAGGRNITTEQSLQVKAYRKFLNRPAIKSIKTTNRDIFDCVDIYKQPALDHPQLKNHTIQMRPSTYLMETKNKTSTFEVPNIGLKNGGCPFGTVPIPRTQIKDIPMAGSHPRFGQKDDERNFPHHWAAMGMKERQSLYGTAAFLNVWKPKVQHDIQFTLSQIWVTAGPYPDENYIEAGWHVYPKLNGDYEPRIFILWTVDGYRSHCYNFQCQGFVQVSRKISPGIRIAPVTTYGGTQYGISLSIVKDMRSGNWLLLWGEDQSELIGYWPKQLFNHLADKAEDIQWGGETYGPLPFPEMGSGHFPEEGAGKACFINNIRVYNNPGTKRDLDPSETHTKTTAPDCYRSIVGRSEEGTYIYFGGPGGNCARQA
ncbi:uncharacterized protein LOC122072086 [Macadamia integrifolia]|uniref:uncharacterized protein LOC122072086 n=1 Tax=Macadamia integrifolia TaxID=60698 RepID=UPI001C4E96DB|nr:uncharacterized protein LOC122072086 [Macadamia integrifolia]